MEEFELNIYDLVSQIEFDTHLGDPSVREFELGYGGGDDE